MKTLVSAQRAALPVIALILAGSLCAMAQGQRASMELIETKTSATRTSLDVTGQVKNISPREISGVTVYCNFQDANGKSIRVAQAHLDTDPLGPNKVSDFKLSTPYSPDIKRFDVTFGQMFGGPLVTKDSRAKSPAGVARSS